MGGSVTREFSKLRMRNTNGIFSFENEYVGRFSDLR